MPADDSAQQAQADIQVCSRCRNHPPAVDRKLCQKCLDAKRKANHAAWERKLNEQKQRMTVFESMASFEDFLVESERRTGYRYCVTNKWHTRKGLEKREYKCKRWRKSRLPEVIVPNAMLIQDKLLCLQAARARLHPRIRHFFDKNVAIGCRFKATCVQFTDTTVGWEVLENHSPNCDCIPDTRLTVQTKECETEQIVSPPN